MLRCGWCGLIDKDCECLRGVIGEMESERLALEWFRKRVDVPDGCLYFMGEKKQ